MSDKQTAALYTRGTLEVHEVENKRTNSMQVREYSSNPRNKGKWWLAKAFRFKKNDIADRESALIKAEDYTAELWERRI